MLLSITQKFFRLHSLYRSAQKNKPTPFFVLHFHTTQPPQDLSNFYTHLLQSHPHPRPISQIHAQTLTQGSWTNSFVATHLLKSYAKVGNLQSAQWVFESVHKKRVFLWNAMIRASSRDELWGDIVDLYRRMEEERVEPDHYTIPFVIKAFGVLGCVEEGKRVHDLVKRSGLVKNVYVATSLMEMYIEFGEIDFALKMFDEMPQRDVVAWTSIIWGYASRGYSCEAMRLFSSMRFSDTEFNWITVLSLIPACDYSVHSFIVKLGFDLFAEVETAILNMYAKSGDIVTAYSLFSGMREKNLVSWTVMVSGYSQNGYANEALSLFHRMLRVDDIRADAAIAASVLQASAQLGSLNYGEMLHGYVIRLGPTSELVVETALVDMYAKCGSVSVAKKVFDGIQDPNVVTWSALIAGYGYNGFGYDALNLFDQMRSGGLIPDEIAFLGVLSACSHSGLVSEGKEFFALMQQTYMVTPGAKHYACMIDILGRAGLMDEAMDLIKEIPVEPDTNVWGALLSACKIKGNVEVAEYACGRLLEMKSDTTDYHVLIANIYAGSGRWDEVSKVRSAIRRKGEKKTPGCSYIEVNCKIQDFFAGERLHPEFNNIHSILESLHTLASDDSVYI